MCVRSAGPDRGGGGGHSVVRSPGAGGEELDGGGREHPKMYRNGEVIGPCSGGHTLGCGPWRVNENMKKCRKW